MENADGEEDMREEGEDLKYELVCSKVLIHTLFFNYSNFWDWMYPVHGGGETTSEAALGVLILWFCW